MFIHSLIKTLPLVKEISNTSRYPLDRTAQGLAPNCSILQIADLPQTN